MVAPLLMSMTSEMMRNQESSLVSSQVLATQRKQAILCSFSLIIRVVDFHFKELEVCISHSCSRPTSWRMKKHKGLNVLVHSKSRPVQHVSRTSALSPNFHMNHTVRYRSFPLRYQSTTYLMCTSSGQWIQFNSTSIFWAIYKGLLALS